MRLTGKCKEEFDKYLISNVLYILVYNVVDWFNDLPEAMRFGVFVDYFDSVNLPIEICVYPYDGSFYYMIDDSPRYEGKFKTRPEARTAAIEKANEIRNKQL